MAARVAPGALVKATVAARRIGVSAETVRAWLRAGTVSGVKIGRGWYMHRAALERILVETR